MTVKGEIEQTEESRTTATSNTRSLRSKTMEDDSKKAVPVEKRSKTAVSGGSSELPARTNKTSLPRQVSTRSADSTNPSVMHRSERALRTSTPLKSMARETPAASGSSSPKSPASLADRQASSRTQRVQAETGLDSKTSRDSQSLTTSPMSTRSRSSVLSSPVKFTRDSRTSRELRWSEKPTIHTYERKHRVDKYRTTNRLRSTVSSQHLSTTAHVDSSPKKPGRPRKVDKDQTPDSSRSKASSEENNLGTGTSGKSPRKRRDVAVQADSQSSAGSSHLLHHSNLHSTASLLGSLTSRARSNTLTESCRSGKSAVSAKSSTQYDTCLESASSQLPDTEDVDDEELDRLARLAHGSPQSGVVCHSSEDENVTNHTTVPAEQTLRSSTVSREKSSRDDTRWAAAVAHDLDGSLDTDKASSPKKRRTEIDEMKDLEQPPKSSRVTSQLSADGGEKLVKSVSDTGNIAESSFKLLSKLEHWKRSLTEVSSSQVEKSSMEPVAGPSGIAPRMTRSQNISKEKSHGSGLNLNTSCSVSDVPLYLY